jgi:hypothetical protein
MQRSFDPLSFIPSPEAIRKHLADAEGLARRLRILLKVAERIEATTTKQADRPRLPGRKGAVHVD